MIKELTTENFNDEIKDNLVLIDFYAVWCGPCKMMHPVLEKISEEYQNIKILKINVDDHEKITREYGVMSIPTLLLFKNGEMVEKNVGFMPKENIELWLNRYLEK